ncbi:MAG: thiamine pyrophosphate-binding protein [Acidimicrobiia bacterium]
MSFYGSDAVVETLSDLGIQHLALNPGASTRGIHESLVNTGHPELFLSLHEEIAVAVAHGYYKAGGTPMAALLHDLVGLQHASMAIYNAWIDQVPILLLGGAGPSDATKRRPWIDWIHSPRWQSLTVRDIVKWSDEPQSLDATLASLSRAMQIAQATPEGPTYVAIDSDIQEQVAHRGERARPNRHSPAQLVMSNPDLDRAAALIQAAERPAILADSVGRSRAGYEALTELAELVGAAVIDLGARHNFPNQHWADCTDARKEILASSDLVLCLDVRDIEWALSEIDLKTRRSRLLIRPDTTIVNIGLNSRLHTSFVDREVLAPNVFDFEADTSVALWSLVTLLCDRVEMRQQQKDTIKARSAGIRVSNSIRARRQHSAVPIAPSRVAVEVWQHLERRPWILANGSLSGWARRIWQWDRFGCFLGTSGGAGVGYGPGASIGAGLALKNTDTLVVDLQADGDLLYTPSALWSAAHHRIPLLIVTQNNRSYGKDRLHQATLASNRDRGQDRVHIGIDIDDPPINLAKLAEAQGVEGFGPVLDPEDLGPVLERAVRAVGEGRPALVDVVVSE